MNKIKAYTIMEMVVVMLLSGLVISIAFKSFDLLSKSYLDFKTRQSSLASYATLDRLLRLDFMRGRELRKTEDGIRVVFPDKTIQYSIGMDYILRRQEALTDTFRLDAKEVELLFAYQKVVDNDRLVDELRLENLYKEEIQHFHYRKNYAADVLMKEEMILSSVGK